MQFGLCNIPAVFLHFIKDVLRHMLVYWVFVYLKGILIYSRSEVNHVLRS